MVPLIFSTLLVLSGRAEAQHLWWDIEKKSDATCLYGEVTVLATASWSERQIALMWAKSYHQGRVFYSSVGHAPVTYENPSIQRILAAAIRWCGRGAPP